MMKSINLRFAFVLILFFYCANTIKAQTVTDTIGNTIVEISVAVDTNHFTGGYTSGPWDLFWGPDQKLWYTNEKRLCTYDPVTQIVDTILEINSGFIMSVATHDDFQNNPFVYLVIDTNYYYGAGGLIKLFKYDYDLSTDSLYNPQFILQWNHGGEHSGGRIIYGSDDKLYVSTAEYYRQNDTLFNNSGKVLRINPDGTVPVDNPRGDYTFSYGHRNPQGIVQVPNGNIFVSEYGSSWDELNLIQANRYYGWMIYDGVTCLGNTDSCNYYDTIAVFPLDAARNPPSGIDFYNNFAIPEFYGLVQAVTGAIAQGLIVYTMNSTYDSVVTKSYYLTQEYGRVRDVCAASDGSVYFIAHDRNRADIHVIRNPLFNSIGDRSNEINISIFPNPANDELHILKKGVNGKETIQIINFTGLIVYDNKNMHDDVIDVRNFSNGVYLLKIFNQNSITTKKFLVEH